MHHIIDLFTIYIPRQSLNMFLSMEYNNFTMICNCICLKFKNFQVYEVIYVKYAFTSPTKNTFKIGLGIKTVNMLIL